jgi:hypothetical protein
MTWLVFWPGMRDFPAVAEDTKKVADHTLERVRRVGDRLDRMDAKIGTLAAKVDGLIDLATGTRADFLAFLKLYPAQEDRRSRIEKDVSLIKKRLDPVDA